MAQGMRGCGVWEAQRAEPFVLDPDRAYLVARNDAEGFLDRVAAAYALNDKERTDFASYWIGALSANPWSMVQLLDSATYQKWAKLTVEPRSIYALRGRIEAYKEGIAKCTEPIGQFKNDNVMITNSVICCETREQAREIALRKGRGYLVSMVNLYHDTMPKSQDAITWPSPPLSLRELSAGDPDALLDATSHRTIGVLRCHFTRP